MTWSGRAMVKRGMDERLGQHFFSLAANFKFSFTTTQKKPCSSAQAKPQPCATNYAWFCGPWTRCERNLLGLTDPIGTWGNCRFSGAPHVPLAPEHVGDRASGLCLGALLALLTSCRSAETESLGSGRRLALCEIKKFLWILVCIKLLSQELHVQIASLTLCCIMLH